MPKRVFSEDPVLLQLLGFLKTPALWHDSNYFPFSQLLLKEKEISEIKRIPELPNNIALGRRMEHFFQFYMNDFSTEEIIAHNLQIIPEKVTLGELDFLLKNKNTEQFTHVELVYKFYVYDPTFKIEKQRWIGPNRRDTLVKKLEKLEKLQFPLLYRPETEATLDQLGIKASEVVQKTCFKALLFLPRHFQNQKIPQINNECLISYWLHFDDFTAQAYSNYQFYAPEKQDWPIEPQFCQNWYSFSEIKEQILQNFQNKKSPFIWMKKNETEFERFFVVWW